jgi:hypothetical protein
MPLAIQHAVTTTVGAISAAAVNRPAGVLRSLGMKRPVVSNP